ncbi:MAG: choice-of-anchor D domain-containing protein [Thermoanaerobaculia bacterium]|nr:choice-of-anchor D domain-containing protein [Thermoanaerobaculia bacterium]
MAGPLGLLAGWLLRVEPARPELSVRKLDFGTLRAHESEQREVTLRNAGEAELEIASMVLEGDSGGALRLASDSCSGIIVPGGAECRLRVIFDPATDGEYTGSLVPQWASVGRSELPMLSVLLSGRAISSRLALSPATADYGSVTVGQWGPRHAVELSNAGTAPLEVRSVVLRGLASADFVRATDGCAEKRLEPRGQCRVEFDFVPTAEGERTAEVVVESDADHSGATPELFGVGIAPRPGLSISPIVLDFGPVRAGDSARAAGSVRELRLLNDGDAELRLVDVGLTRGDAGFLLDASECARGTLAAGASCRLRISFRPRAEGETTSVVLIEHDAGGGSKRVPLTGIGTRPRLEVSPSPLFLGRVPSGRVGEWHELELRNAGSANLTIHSLKLDGLDRRSFEMAADGCRGIVPPGTSCTAQFRIVPRRAGPQRAEVVVRHDGPGASTTITVNGIGI